MKTKLLLLLSFVLVCTMPLRAQRLVIGSKAPSLKSVEWLGDTPEVGGGKAILVEFYQSSNPSSVKFFEKLGPINDKYGSKMMIVVLGRDSRDAMLELTDLPYFVGFDAGGAAYSAYGVRFTPFTMLVDSKGNVAWMGNLGNITDAVLEGVE